jgi:hypothetical protein
VVSLYLILLGKTPLKQKKEKLLQEDKKPELSQIPLMYKKSLLRSSKPMPVTNQYEGNLEK